MGKVILIVGILGILLGGAVLLVSLQSDQNPLRPCEAARSDPVRVFEQVNGGTGSV